MRVLIALVALVALVAAQNSEDPVLNTDIVEVVNHMQHSWKAGVNSYFEGWTVEDAKKSMGALPKSEDSKLPTMVYPETVTRSLPESFDSREQWQGCIGPVLNQAKCGSCWAFGAAEAVSDRLCINHKTNGSFVQRAPLDLVACDYGFMGNNGCEGGSLETAWNYVKAYGLVSESCSPYLVSEGGPIPTCAPQQQPCLNFVNTPQCNKTCHNGADWSGDKVRISSVYSVSSDADQIAAEIMQNGPVEAAFTVYADFPHYKSGVYRHTSGNVLGGHAIKIIGWGVESGEDFWLVQNSWTTTWGDGGYFKIARGTNECGIEDDVVAGSV